LVWAVSLTVLLAVGCRNPEMSYDYDGDGWDDESDCAPQDATIHPDAAEVADCIDNNCDGDVDEGTELADDDGDGFCEGGDLGDGEIVCCDGSHTGDCDDADPSRAPGQAELADCIDNDCDGNVDEDLATMDGDGDGYCEGHDLGSGEPECCDGSEPGDCDDSNPDLSPFDGDGDGYDPCGTTGGVDCDDENPAVHPDAEDVCDNLSDNNCDGIPDPLEYDDDGDGYSECGGDCDDADTAYNPDAVELCDGQDNDCDGAVPADEVDDDLDNWMVCDGDCDDQDAAANLDDLDGDGSSTCDGDCDDGDAALTPVDADGDGASSCAGDCNDADPALNIDDADGDGQTTCQLDCDDADPGSWLGAPELCDGVDNDCDGSVPADETTDADGDGYVVCEECDDGAADVYPGAAELCDGVDNDCDGSVPADETTDSDGDGYVVCEECDDGAADVYPGAVELCDGADNDCDGLVPADETTDADGDGYVVCEECDDAAGDVYPGATELCDGVDNDCDGAVPADEADADGDGYLACEECDDTAGDVFPTAAELCDGIDNDCDGSVPADEADDDGDGARICDGDCADGDPAIHPAAAEVCNDGIDNNCDGTDSGCAHSGTASLADADAKFYGEAVGDEAGYALGPAGDVDDDGYDDIVVGAWNHDAGGSYAGAAYLLYGPPAAGVFSLSSADVKLVGEEWADSAGKAVAGAGDINGDGHGDLVVGAPGEHSIADWAGGAYVLYGPLATGTTDLSAADAKLTGEASGDTAGEAVSAAGDLNGDGYDDLLVGATGDDTGGSWAGAVYLILGPVSGTASLSTADAKIIGASAYDGVGRGMAAVYDQDGDGYDEILIGAPGEDSGADMAGAAYLIPGPLSGTYDLSSAPAMLRGEDIQDQSGGTLAAGDVDGDGIDDLLVGAENRDSPYLNGGTAYTVLGPVSGVVGLNTADGRHYGDDYVQLTGAGLDAAGDVDGDGVGDLLVGAPGANKAALWYGPISGTFALSTADAEFTGENNADYAGGSVYGAGDVSADGYADILVGAYADGTLGNYTGAIYLIYGSGM